MEQKGKKRREDGVVDSTGHRLVRPPTETDLIEAQKVVSELLTPTPVLHLEVNGRPVFFKNEAAQVTGSFKVRGALAALSAVSREHPGQEILTVSAGNHGLGVAYASRLLGVQATIVVPATASPAKVAKLRALGANLVEVGEGFAAAEHYALHRAEQEHAYFISPYNDPHVIAGQATVAREFLDQVPGLSQLVVPVGGGGLASGIVVATRGTNIDVLGVQPSSNAAMVAALTGSPFFDGVTAADGLAGDVERGSVTIDLLRAAGVVVVTVSESAIARAVVLAFSELGMVLEASGAVGLAALSEGLVPQSERTGVLLTGRNVSVERYRELLSQGSQTL